MDLFSGLVLVAATVTVGLVAGVFGLYAHTIMPGLSRTDDRTFVVAFQSGVLGAGLRPPLGVRIASELAE